MGLPLREFVRPERDDLGETFREGGNPYRVSNLCHSLAQFPS